jgi:hypothetical protein
MDKQPFPKKGILFKNLDLNLEQVLKKLGTEQKPEIYAYILSTVSFSKEQDQFVQKGSAPNFQGDYITLCTCKHYMRSRRSVADWKNVWIAGFTSHERGENYLFYLMQVEAAFGSFRELWENSLLSASTKQAKNASKNSMGDLFPPLSMTKGNDFSFCSYKKPIEGHVHLPEDWHNDIQKSKCAPVLIGNPEFSFLWTKPLIVFSSSRKQHRGHWRYSDLQKFRSDLKESPAA